MTDEENTQVDWKLQELETVPDVQLLFMQMAQAARTHHCMISLNVSPYSDGDEE